MFIKQLKQPLCYLFKLPDSSYILVTVNSETHPTTDITWRGSYNSSCVYHTRHQECSDMYDHRLSPSINNFNFRQRCSRISYKYI